MTLRSLQIAVLALLSLLMLAAPALAKERIVGGAPVAEGEFPWVAALVEKRENAYWGQLCGGSLIHPRWVVTATTCVEGMRAEKFDVVLGRSNLMKRGGERIAVADIKMHPGGMGGRSDIALLYLAKKSKMEPAPISASGPWLAGKGQVLGWGAKRRSHPHRLHKAEIDFLNYQKCLDAYDWEYITPLMYCAGKKDGSIDSCWEDIGGPLLFQGKLLAVISWKYGCADAALPGVYSHLNPIKDWIDYHIANPPSGFKSVSAGKDHNRKPKPFVDFYFISITDETDSLDNQYLLFVESNYKILKSAARLNSKQNSFFCEAGLLRCVNSNTWFKQKRGLGLRHAITFFASSNDQCADVKFRVKIQNRKKPLWRWGTGDGSSCARKSSQTVQRVRLR